MTAGADDSDFLCLFFRSQHQGVGTENPGQEAAGNCEKFDGLHDRPRNHISVTYITRILCPPLSAQAALDWKGPEHRYYTDIADFIRQASDKPQEDLDELWCRIVFTILVSNTDDHLKNHGFLYAGRSRWRLSPAFDINPAPMRQRMLQTGIMEGSSFEVSLTLALEAAPRFGLEPRNAKRTVARMAKVVHENWRKDFRAAGASSHETQAFVPAFEHRAMELALSLQ